MKRNVKRYLELSINAALVCFLLFTVGRYFSTYLDARQYVGKQLQLDGLSHVSAEPGSETKTDLQSHTAFIFFATWCGPCLVELGRVNSAVQDGELDPSRIAAISIDDSEAEVIDYLAESKLPIPTYFDNSRIASRSIGLRSTPTIVYLDAEQNIADISSGLSLFLVNKLRDSYDQK